MLLLSFIMGVGVIGLGMWTYIDYSKQKNNRNKESTFSMKNYILSRFKKRNNKNKQVVHLSEETLEELENYN